MTVLLDVRPAVREALEAGQPVVALESTVIAHGLPHPHNVETAMELEGIIRETGCVPATIAVIQGRPTVGLTPAELHALAEPGRFEKVGVRDLPVVAALGRNGATTVSATMAIASLAGIRVFVTGGIGGVHRGASSTFDISSDLTELARTDVAVVCAGAKAILDLGLTLEYLETLGVPVIGFGTDSFPAFYLRDSGFPVPQRVDSPEEAAAVMKVKWAMGLKGGLLIANPIRPEDELNGGVMEAAIQQAVDEAARRGITGKPVTPHLLSRLAQLTDGATIEANIALLRNNARVGAAIARAYYG